MKFDFLNTKLVLMIVVVVIFYYLFETLRFYWTLKTLNAIVKFRYILRLSFINIFVSTVTPFATGGGIAQIYFLSKENVAVGKSTAAALIRTLIPILFFFICAPFILLSSNLGVKLITSSGAIGVIVISIILCLYILFIIILFKLIRNPRSVKKFVFKIIDILAKIKLLKKTKIAHYKNKMAKEINNFSGSLLLFLRAKKSDIFLVILFSLLYLFTLFLIPAILIHSINNSVTLLSVIYIQVVITFIMYFAPTPGATGIAEAGFSLAYVDQIGSNYLISIIFTWRFLTVYLGMLIGVVLFFTELIKMQRREAR